MDSPLSHAAIVAREQGIPAVMGSADATRILANGQRIRVDGTRGMVWSDDTRQTESGLEFAAAPAGALF